MTHHDDLLMMRPAASHPLVEQCSAACFVDVAPQTLVLLRAEGRAVAVRPPQKSAYVDAAPRGRAEQLGDRGTVGKEQLVGVAAPVGEPRQVARVQSGDDVD